MSIVSTVGVANVLALVSIVTTSVFDQLGCDGVHPCFDCLRTLPGVEVLILIPEFPFLSALGLVAVVAGTQDIARPVGSTQ